MHYACMQCVVCFVSVSITIVQIGSNLKDIKLAYITSLADSMHLIYFPCVCYVCGERSKSIFQDFTREHCLCNLSVLFLLKWNSLFVNNTSTIAIE